MIKQTKAGKKKLKITPKSNYYFFLFEKEENPVGKCNYESIQKKKKKKVAQSTFLPIQIM